MALPRRLTRLELPHDTAALARYLIGKIVVRELPEGVASGRIVETEAYVVGDAAGHGYRGMTPRNRSLFLERGHAYVYVAYGISNMLNISSEEPGTGVLIRALEPLEGVAIMQMNRGLERLRDLARGPGRLCTALRIDRSLDGLDLCAEGPPVARARQSGARRSRREHPHRHHTGHRPPVAVLSARQPIRQRPEVAQRISALAALQYGIFRCRRRFASAGTAAKGGASTFAAGGLVGRSRRLL